MCRITSNKETAAKLDQDEDLCQEEQQKKESSPNNRPQWKFSQLFDPTANWVLVENGSFGGHFDYIPKTFRVGPWNIACCMYLFALVYWILLNCVECYINPPPKVSEYTSYSVNTWQWWYNVAGFLWTLYIAYRVTKTDMGWGSWISFTLQSWTLIILRHGLSALSPFFPSLAAWNEYLRYPMLVQTTIVFVIWNFALLPAILTQIKTQEGRRNFVKFCFGFILTQLHIFNLPFAAINGIWGSPARELNRIDFCVALGLALQYVLFYLFFLDRIGLHLYFIFSPRSPLSLISWTAFVGCQYAGFAIWKSAILQYGSPALTA